MTHKLLAENKTAKLVKLIALYKKNPLYARVAYFNGYYPKSEEYLQRRVVMYEEGEDFSFVMYQRSFGISTTSRMFNHERVKCKIMYTKGKFWYVIGKTITQLTFNDLNNFVNSFNTNQFENHVSFTVKEYFINRFSWIRFIAETDILHKRAFNTFVKHELYGLNDTMRHFLKVSLPVVKQIRIAYDGGGLRDGNGSQVVSSNGSHLNHIYQIWNEMRKVLINIDNLTADMLCNLYFVDTCKMARTLGKKVNATWSPKRLKQEHDAWAKEITNILLESQEIKQLKLDPLYLEFAEFSGFDILKTNRDLMIEGMTQNHCVATYVSRVERGECSIFHIQGYTLEVKKRSKDKDNSHLWVQHRGDDYSVSKGPLYIGQFRGRHNSEAPKELIAHVVNAISKFNNEYVGKFGWKDNEPERFVGFTNPCAEIPLGDPQVFVPLGELDDLPY